MFKIGIPTPKVFEEQDAENKVKRALKKFGKEHCEYLFGIKVDTNDLKTFSKVNADKVFSADHSVLEYVEELRNKSHNVRNIPFIFGSYEVDPNKQENSKTVFADITTFDAILLPEAVFLGPGVIATSVFLRGLYWFGRKQWWRHEYTHVLHHLMARKFVSVEENRKETFESERNYGDAFYFIHESGLEELVTRWQSFKESYGSKEKLSSFLAMLFYLEYSPWIAVRNAVTDGKKKLHDKLEKLKVPQIVKTGAKIGFYTSLMAAPALALIYSSPQWYDPLPDKIKIFEDIIQFDKSRIESLALRGYVYYLTSIGGAIFSTKKKGIRKYEKAESTKEYKFPFTYNPVISIARTVKTMHYLSKIWDDLPHYRRLEREEEISEITKQVAGKLKVGQREREFTVGILKDILEHSLKKQMKDVYIKGLYSPYFYFHSKEFFEKSNVI